MASQPTGCTNLDDRRWVRIQKTPSGCSKCGSVLAGGPLTIMQQHVVSVQWGPVFSDSVTTLGHTWGATTASAGGRRALQKSHPLTGPLAPYPRGPRCALGPWRPSHARVEEEGRTTAFHAARSAVTRRALTAGASMSARLVSA